MLTPGSPVQVDVYGKTVSATVLATLGNKVLVEHQFAGASGLRFAAIHQEPGTKIQTIRNPYGYELPLKWLRAIGDRPWIGRPRTGPVPSPAEMLQAGKAEHPKRGWTAVEPGQRWTKTYWGHRLRIVRKDDVLVGYVAMVCAGHHPQTATSRAFDRVAAMTHDLARKIGKGYRAS